MLTNGNLALSFGTSKSDYKTQFSSSKNESGYTSFTLSPKAGFFLANGVMLGLAVDLNSITYNDRTEDSKGTTKQYMIGPVIRFYTPGNFFFHADVAFGKNVEKYSDESMTDSDDSKVSKWQLGVGHAFFVNNHIAIEPNIVYRNTTTRWETDFGQFEGSLGELVLGVGFSIFLHKKIE